MAFGGYSLCLNCTWQNRLHAFLLKVGRLNAQCWSLVDEQFQHDCRAKREKFNAVEWFFQNLKMTAFLRTANWPKMLVLLPLMFVNSLLRSRWTFTLFTSASSVTAGSFGAEGCVFSLKRLRISVKVDLRPHDSSLSGWWLGGRWCTWRKCEVTYKNFRHNAEAALFRVLGVAAEKYAGWHVYGKRG